MTLVVGRNNAGKSTIIKALATIQRGLNDGIADARNGTATTEVAIGLEDLPAVPEWKTDPSPSATFYWFAEKGQVSFQLETETGKRGIPQQLPEVAPLVWTAEPGR